MSEALRANDIVKRFGDTTVIDGSNLSLEENEILLLLGPNGAGKTVFLSCLAGSKRPTSGEVTVFGEQLDAGDRGEMVAFLLQETMAMETLTGKENIQFYSRINADFTDRWERYLSDLGLVEDLGKRVEHYSGGMKRKLELAMTLTRDVPIYLLDEPTAGVDLSMMQKFHDIILERYDEGASFLISSHSPIDAGIADRIAFVPDGAVTTVGKPDELMADVPPVVRVQGSEAIANATSHVLGGELFPVGGEAHGFLPEDTTREEFQRVVDEAEVTEPTYADMFNYYVHIDPSS